MSMFALLATAVLLQLTPGPVTTSMPSVDGSTSLAVATARERWLRALAEVAWDRDHPALRPVADEITAMLLPLATTRNAAPVDVEAVTLLTQISGAPLGAYLHAQPSPDRALLRGWLRWHDDVALFQRWVADLSRNGSGAVIEAVTAVELATMHRPSMAPVLARAVAQTDGGLRERLCSAALNLPPPSRPMVADALARAWHGESGDDPGIACVVLGGATVAGRRELARWIAHLAPMRGARNAVVEPPWIVPAALMLAGTEQREAALRARTLLHDALHSLSGSAHLLAIVVPSLPLRSPAARHVLALLATSMSNTFVPLLAARVVAHDGTLFVQATEALASTRVDGAVLRSAIGVIGAVPAHDAAAQSAARTLLLSTRERLQLPHADTVNVTGLDRWLRAIDTVSACHGQRPCLVDLVLHGADAAGARATMVLGPPGLASLSIAQQNSLVRRLMVHPDPWLLLAVLAQLQGCPQGLRGLREIGDALEFDDLHAGVQPLVEAFEATCASSR